MIAFVSYQYDNDIIHFLKFNLSFFFFGGGGGGEGRGYLLSVLGDVLLGYYHFNIPTHHWHDGSYLSMFKGVC